MKQYRISKYNPDRRDSHGNYLVDEWTSYSDVGKTVSENEYEKIESAYIQCAIKLLEDQNIRSLSLSYIENHNNYKKPELDLQLGSSIHITKISKVIQAILRDKFWAKLEIDIAFIHIGYDYYMYVGLPAEPQTACKFCKSLGLFVEEFVSPYL